MVERPHWYNTFADAEVQYRVRGAKDPAAGRFRIVDRDELLAK